MTYTNAGDLKQMIFHFSRDWCTEVSGGRTMVKKVMQSFLTILISLSLGACATGMRFIEAEKRLTEAEKQLELERSRQRETDKEKMALRKELEDLQEEFDASKRINEQLSMSLAKLSEQAQELKVELHKQKSVVNLQEQVIQLLDDTRKSIESSLKDQIVAQNITIEDTDDKLKVILVDKILFDSGSCEVNEEGKRLLLILSETLNRDSMRQIVVEGHTDNVPLGGQLRERFPSNWELSAARAASVIRLLQSDGGVEPNKLSLKGYGSYRPIAPNNTEEGRMQNRRIEIILGVSQ
jgi:chemotaxis protein MotB